MIHRTLLVITVAGVIATLAYALAEEVHAQPIGETFTECLAGQRDDNDGISLLPNACQLTSNDSIWHDAEGIHDFCRETVEVGCDIPSDCLGRCGPGCGASGAGVYSLDCAEHDRCCRVHGGCFDPGDLECGDEFLDALDDFLFGSPNCVKGCRSPIVRSPWPMFGHDPQHTGRSRFVGPQTNALKWTHPFNAGDLVCGPVIVGDDGKIYVGTGQFPDSGRVHAINLDGTEAWKYDLVGNGSFCFSLALGADGTIYIGAAGHLIALNQTGNLRWTALDFLGSFGSPTVGKDGTVYVGSATGQIYAVNPDGTVKWRFLLDNAASYEAPAIGLDGTVLVGDLGGKLYAVRSDGTLKWTYQVNNNAPTESTFPSGASVGSDGTIYVAGNNTGNEANFLALNPNGTRKWLFPLGPTVTGVPGIAKNGTIYLMESTNLYAFDPSGTLKWIYKLGGNFSSAAPAIGADGLIYIQSDGAVAAVLPNGTQKWRFNIVGPSFGSAVIAKNKVYASSGNTLLAFGNQ